MSGTVHSLNGFDWFLLLILGWSTLSALMRGMARVLLSLAGWSVGLIAAGWGYLKLAPYLLPVCKTLPMAQGVSFVLIVGVCVVIAALLGAALHKSMHAAGLGFFNRVGGALIGMGRGFLVGASLLMVIAAFMPKSETISQSKLSPYFLAGAHAVSFFVPGALQNKVAFGTARLNDTVPSFTKSR